VLFCNFVSVRNYGSARVDNDAVSIKSELCNFICKNLDVYNCSRRDGEQMITLTSRRWELAQNNRLSIRAR